MIGTLVRLLIGLVLLGVATYLVERFVPMHPAFRIAIRVVVVVIVILYIATVFDLVGPWG